MRPALFSAHAASPALPGWASIQPENVFNRTCSEVFTFPQKVKQGVSATVHFLLGRVQNLGGPRMNFYTAASKSLHDEDKDVSHAVNMLLQQGMDHRSEEFAVAKAETVACCRLYQDDLHKATCRRSRIFEFKAMFDQVSEEMGVGMVKWWLITIRGPLDGPVWPLYNAARALVARKPVKDFFASFAQVSDSTDTLSGWTWTGLCELCTVRYALFFGWLREVTRQLK